MNNQKEVRRLDATLKRLKYAENTRKIYIMYFSQFAREIGKPLNQVNETEIIDYLNSKNYGRSKQNQFINAIKAHYEIVLGQKKKVYKLKRPKKTKPLPNVIDRHELVTKLRRIQNLKPRTLLTLTYSVGLRVSEVIKLKPINILSGRMRIKIDGAKNWKDRYVPLSPVVLKMLRHYYKRYQPSDYLFEGKYGGYISPSTARKYFKRHISRDHKFHDLRHSFATHMHDKGVRIEVIQEILGHENIETTQLYAKVSTRSLQSVELPV